VLRDVEVRVLRDVDWCGSRYWCRLVSECNKVRVRVLPADLIVDDATLTLAKWPAFSHTDSCRQAGQAWMQSAEGGEFAFSENGRLVMIRKS
jgi:hypothetical protein